MGTTIGVTTDFDGNYDIETREDVSEIMASFVSYERQTVAVKKGAFNTIDFKLVPIVTHLDEVKVKPGENPAHAILRNISKNKKRNNPAEKESYSYTTYTKMELDIANMKPEFKNKKLQKNFGFIFQYMDTSAITGEGLSTGDDLRGFGRLLLSSFPEIIKGDRESQSDFGYRGGLQSGPVHGASACECQLV